MKTGTPKEKAADLIESAVRDNLRKIDREERFDAMLDECYSFEAVGGPFAHMSPASVLKEMDPIAYRCGVNDWADGEDFTEVDGETYDRQEVQDQIDDLVSELESEISDLEAEEDDDNQGEIDELQAVIAELNTYL